MTKGNDPAFSNLIGLSKREYFAAMALQGNIASANINQDLTHEQVNLFTKEAVMFADSLIKNLNSEEQSNEKTT